MPMISGLDQPSWSFMSSYLFATGTCISWMFKNVAQWTRRTFAKDCTYWKYRITSCGFQPSRMYLPCWLFVSLSELPPPQVVPRPLEAYLLSLMGGPVEGQQSLLQPQALLAATQALSLSRRIRYQVGKRNPLELPF
jgi:hypothetical protein